MSEPSRRIALDARRRIAFDARLWGAPPTGIGRWTRGLLSALVAAAPDDVWIALGPEDPLRASFDGHANVEVCHTDPRRHLAWQLATLPGLLKAARADAFLSPWNLATAPRYGGKQVAWLHDLIPFRAEAHGFRATYRYKTRLTLWLARRKMDALVVVSQWTAGDTRETLGLPESLLHVVHPGIDHDLFRPPEPAAAHAVRSRHGLPERFVLAVGGAEPRKNLRLAVDAWRALPPAAREGAVLALGGSAFRGRGVLDDVADAEALGIRDLGRLPDDDLPVLYGAATAFVYPSLSEGFGLPPVEAMACGAPVIACNRTSIPEAVGGGALVVEPETDAFAAALESVLADASVAADLRRRGLARAAEVTWEAAAAKVLEVLAHVG